MNKNYKEYKNDKVKANEFKDVYDYEENKKESRNYYRFDDNYVVNLDSLKGVRL